MTPDQNPLVAGVEQILLVVFILMLFAGIAGGNPAMVLKPTLDIVGQIVGALLGLLCTLISTVFRAVLSLLVAAPAIRRINASINDFSKHQSPKTIITIHYRSAAQRQEHQR